MFQWSQVNKIKQRADRLSIDLSNIHVSTDMRFEYYFRFTQSSTLECDVVVIDSIQTMYSHSLDAPLGYIHIKVTSRLVGICKTSGKVVVIVGHVTKEGDIYGAKTLEHLVDCVFRGERHSHYELLSSKKQIRSLLIWGSWWFGEMSRRDLLKLQNHLIW